MTRKGRDTIERWLTESAQHYSPGITFLLRMKVGMKALLKMNTCIKGKGRWGWNQKQNNSPWTSKKIPSLLSCNQSVENVEKKVEKKENLFDGNNDKNIQKNQSKNNLRWKIIGVGQLTGMSVHTLTSYCPTEMKVEKDMINSCKEMVSLWVEIKVFLSSFLWSFSFIVYCMFCFDVSQSDFSLSSMRVWLTPTCLWSTIMIHKVIYFSLSFDTSAGKHIQ